MTKNADPWELLEEVNKAISDWLELPDSMLDLGPFSRVDDALKVRKAEKNARLARYPKDVLCPRCEMPKTNPYKCESCSEWWGKREKPYDDN